MIKIGLMATISITLLCLFFYGIFLFIKNNKEDEKSLEKTSIVCVDLKTNQELFSSYGNVLKLYYIVNNILYIYYKNKNDIDYINTTNLRCTILK